MLLLKPGRIGGAEQTTMKELMDFSNLWKMDWRVEALFPASEVTVCYCGDFA